MCISRFSYTEDFFLTEPFSPKLFSQGDHVGPELLLQFQSKRLAEDDLAKAWKNQKDGNTSKKEIWPEAMQLFCRGCSDEFGEEVMRPLKDFGEANPSQYSVGTDSN